MDGTTITVSSDSTMITLSGINDDTLEGSETIVISLSNEAELQLLYPNATLPVPLTITLIDDEGTYCMTVEMFIFYFYLVGQAIIISQDPDVTEFSDASVVEAMFCVDLGVVDGTDVDIEVEIEVTSGNRNLPYCHFY